jgi:hypothetical protein
MDWRVGPLLLVMLLATLALLAIPRAARPHDSWISRGGLRNAAGEWCCGAGDCDVVPGRMVSARADGYHVVVWPRSDAEPVRAEIVPYAEAQRGLDGAYWRCRRPDGTRRCFFAPEPGS